MGEAPQVFLSYSHDSNSHRKQVLALSERLRQDGIETSLDRYVNGTPPEGWPRWMLNRLDASDRVLLICTPTYYRRFRGHEEPGKGKGADWEGAIITQDIYDARSATTRFIPILFDPADEASIPEPVRSQTRYCLTSEPSYQDLLDALFDRAGIEPGPIGSITPKARQRGEPITFGTTASPSEPRVELSHLSAGAEHFLGHQPELAALLEAAQQKGLLVLAAVPIPSTGTAATLIGAGADTTPLTDAVLSDAMSQQIAKNLVRIRERYQNGDRAGAVAEIDELLELRAWSHLAANLRGRLLRTAALYRLDFDQDQEGSEALAARAAAEDPDGDSQVLEAHLALHRGNMDTALELLNAPRSPQARHLKAAILIEDGDADAALGILAAPTEPARENTSDAAPHMEPMDADGNTAETWRLRALAYLLLKRLPDALEAIDAARALAPNWIAVRSATALIDFWRVCTPAALALTEQPLWPMPFTHALVRADAGARLAEIEQTCATVADTMPAGSGEQRHWLTWRLIALLAAGDRRDAATELAKHLIGDDGPLHIWPLLWACFFGLDIERARLKERLKSIPVEAANFILLIGLYIELRLEDGEAEAVLADLEEIAPAVETLGHIEIPRQWRVLALMAAGRPGEARAVVDTIVDERLRLRMHLHIARSQETETPGSHKAAAAALFVADPGPDSLAEACEAHAKAGDWAFVATHADELLEAIPTPGSLRLLVIAAFNTGEYRRCLTDLDEHCDVYPDGRLPHDLALLRVRCQRALGEPSLAVRDAQLLYEEAPTAEHLVELLNAQLAAANAPGIREALHHLSRIEPADGHLLLQGARIAVQFDRNLAIALWRRAIASEPPDEAQFALQAATLGENLGLDPDETGPWFQRMAELAEPGDGSLQMLHISEIPQFVREQQDATRQWLDKFWHGEIPAHMLASGILDPLPVMLHADPAQNRGTPDPLKQHPILIRHGARPLGFPKASLEPRPRLVLDLSALITAQSLGLLDRIEAAFGPLWLHRHWHQMLRTEVERLMPLQPRHSTMRTHIGELIRCSGIALVDLDAPLELDKSLSALVGEPVARELEWAQSCDGHLLTYLPLHGADIEQWREVDLPSPWGEVVLGPRDLLDGLRAEGLIDSERHRQATAAFPPEPETGYPPRLPAVGSVLLSNMVMLGQFAELGLLTALSHRFRLRIPTQDWDRDEQQEALQRQRAELADWTGKLIDRVSAGRQTERYRLLPAHGPESDAGSPRHNGLDDLLAHPGEPGDRLWVDDRFVNGFPHTGGMTIVGVVEILDLLRKQGTISRAERFELLHQLRASNYRFIPFDADEILHWLLQAHSESDRLIVPAQLDVLAQYWAACLYQGDALQWTGNEHHGQGEIPFFVSSQSAVAEVLRTIWSDDRLNVKRRRQRADWVLDNLYVGVGDIPHLVPEPSPEHDANLVGMDLAELCAEAFQVMLERIGRDRKTADQDKTTAKHAREHALGAAADYLRWICARIVTPRLLADPPSAASTAAAFRGLLLGSFAANGDELLPLFGSWLLRFLPIMPPVLRDELHKDQDLMRRLGLEQFNYVEVDDLHFRVRDLWPRVQKALHGARPILLDCDRNQPFSLSRVSSVDDSHPMLELADAEGRVVGHHYFQFSELLFDAREQRIQALRSNPHWWDGDPRGAEAIERELSAIDSVATRVREIRRIMARSADAHYMGIEEKWPRNGGFTFDRCFPPPLSAVLTYIRCTEPISEGESITERCWDALVRSIPPERGLVECLRRIALLPCPLPSRLHQAIAALDLKNRLEVVQLAASEMTNAVGHLHLIDLLLASAGDIPKALNLAQEQILFLLTPHFAEELKLTRALVDLSYRAFGTEAEETVIEPRRQLLAAWVHAGRVTGIMRRAGVNLDHLAKSLEQWAPFPARDLYADSHEPTTDIAWPWHVKTVDLVFDGLGRILSRYQNLVPQLDLSALQERLARLDAGTAEPNGDIYLLRDKELLTDTLGCLWGGDRSVNLAPLIGVEKASRFGPAAFAELIDGLLDELSVDPQPAELWHSLYVTVAQGRLPPHSADRLDEILSHADIDALIASDHLLLIHLMDLAIWHRRDRESVIAQIYRWAEDVDTGNQPTPPFREQFGIDAMRLFSERLVHWLHGLAVRHPEDPDGEFARLLDGLILRSRTLAADLRIPLTSIARHMPFSRHRALRRTLLAARARSLPAMAAASAQEPGNKKQVGEAGRKKRQKKRARRVR
jgi:tetratricopeptide (TPR) repeat protein